MSYNYLTSTERGVVQNIPFPVDFEAREYVDNRKRVGLARYFRPREPPHVIERSISFGHHSEPPHVIERSIYFGHHYGGNFTYFENFDLSSEYLARQQLFNAVQALYQSRNTPRDRQVADRLMALYRDALGEEQDMLAESIKQFADFFLHHPEPAFPKITLTPDGTIRARWIRGEGDFTAIEFTGHTMVKLVTEIPREGGLTARYFGSEPFSNVVSAAGAVGASFASHA